MFTWRFLLCCCLEIARGVLAALLGLQVRLLRWLDRRLDLDWNKEIPE